MVFRRVLPGTLSALWLRLRALDGLLCSDLRDRLFQHTICLFPGLRLKRANSTALSALDVLPQRQASLVLCAYGRVVLACSSRFVTQTRELRPKRMPSMGPALKPMAGCRVVLYLGSVRNNVCESVEIHDHGLMMNRSWNCKAS